MSKLPQLLPLLGGSAALRFIRVTKPCRRAPSSHSSTHTSTAFLVSSGTESTIRKHFLGQNAALQKQRRCRFWIPPAVPACAVLKRWPLHTSRTAWAALPQRRGQLRLPRTAFQPEPRCCAASAPWLVLGIYWPGRLGSTSPVFFRYRTLVPSSPILRLQPHKGVR